MVNPLPVKPASVSAKAASALTGLSLPSVYRRIRDGSLPLLRLGGFKRINLAALEAIAERQFTTEEIAAAEAQSRKVICK